MSRNTSVSDNNLFPEFCYTASKHDDIFQNFKMHPVFSQIIGSWAYEPFVSMYLEVLQRIVNNPNFRISDEALEKMLRIDSLGNPQKISITIRNEIDPDKSKDLVCSLNYIRYLKVAFDIFSFFDTTKIKTVSEIGVGYGGQCSALVNLFSVTQYNLIDLPEVLSLAERCLTESDTTAGIRYFDGTHLYYDLPSDFFISSFAFSELKKSVQDHYLEKVLLKSKAGYITWNDGIDKKVWGTDGYTLQEILSIIPGAEAYFIPPQTYQGDQKVCVVLWGHENSQTEDRK